MAARQRQPVYFKRIAIDCDGNLLAVATDKGCVQLWRHDHLRPVLNGSLKLLSQEPFATLRVANDVTVSSQNALPLSGTGSVH